jgi:hypothetical protein
LVVDVDKGVFASAEFVYQYSLRNDNVQHEFSRIENYLRRLPPRPASMSARSRAAIARVTGLAITGDGDDVAGRLHHLAHHVVLGVGDEEVPGRVHGEAMRRGKLGVCGRAAIVRVTSETVTGDAIDRAGGTGGDVRAVAAVGGGHRLRPHAHGRGGERGDAIDQGRRAQARAVVEESDSPSSGCGDTGGEPGDMGGEGDRLAVRHRSGRRDDRRGGRRQAQQRPVFQVFDEECPPGDPSGRPASTAPEPPGQPRAFVRKLRKSVVSHGGTSSMLRVCFGIDRARTARGPNAPVGPGQFGSRGSAPLLRGGAPTTQRVSRDFAAWIQYTCDIIIT